MNGACSEPHFAQCVQSWWPHSFALQLQPPPHTGDVSTSRSPLELCTHPSPSIQLAPCHAVCGCPLLSGRTLPTGRTVMARTFGVDRSGGMLVKGGGDRLLALQALRPVLHVPRRLAPAAPEPMPTGPKPRTSRPIPHSRLGFTARSPSSPCLPCRSSHPCRPLLYVACRLPQWRVSMVSCWCTAYSGWSFPSAIG